jgi:hypothetical protein
MEEVAKLAGPVSLPAKTPTWTWLFKDRNDIGHESPFGMKYIAGLSV